MARKIEVKIVGDASSLNKAFGSSSKSASGFGKSMLKVGKFAAAGLAGVGVGAVVAGKKMIDLASDAEEVRSKMEVVFGKALPGLTKNIDAFSKATGTSRFAMREQAADLGALLAPLVGTKDKAAEMSLQFTKLATDLGSFNNVPTADALLAIRSGLVGEAEPLRRFGVLLNEAAVKAEGLRLGLIKGNEAMTEQEKVQARASLIMQQTALAQGDATRTAGSMANQMKALKSAVSDTATELGMKLIPFALKVVTTFNQNWPAIQRVAGQVFGAVGRALSELKDSFERNWPRIKAAGQSVMAWYKANLEPTIVSVARNIQLAWNKTMTALTSDAKGGTSKTSGVWRTWASGLVSTLNAALALLRGDWSAAWANMKAALVSFVKTVNGVMIGFQNLVWNAAKAIGRAIVDGIVAGASGLSQRLSGALTSQISSAVSGVKGFFGIRSPSTYTAKEIGKPLGEGIVQGMDGGLALLLPKAQARIAAWSAKLAAQIVAQKARLAAAFGTLTDKLLRAFDATRGGMMTPAEAALAAISDRRRTDELNRALADAVAGGDPEAIARAQEDIQIASLERQAQVERTALDQQTEAMREKLETKLAAMSQVWKGGTADILKLLQGFGVDFGTVGALLGNSFRQSLVASINGASRAAGGKGGVAASAGAGGGGQPIVLQTFLDGKLVAESVQTHATQYQRSNGAWLQPV